MNPVLLLIIILFLGNPGSRRNLQTLLGPFSLFSSGGPARPAASSDLSGHPGSAAPGRTRIRMPMPPLAVPGYIDTFKMELLLDRLHTMTSALEKINHLNQTKKVPNLDSTSRFPQVDRVQDSLDAVKGLLVNGKSARQIDNLSGALSNVKKLGDMEQLMSTFGPLLSMMTNSDDK